MSNVAEDTLIAARSRVESKVIERRTNYDRGIVRASQMALAIGGFRGYEGYEGFDLDSFDAGKMNFSVADRPVFPETATQRNEKFIQDQTAVTSGAMPKYIFAMRNYGLTVEEAKRWVTESQLQRVPKVVQ